MAGTVVVTHHSTGLVRKITMTCTGDEADGSFPATVLPAIEGALLHLETNPGTPAPTANYDVTIVNQNGIDVLVALGANRHTTNSERVEIVGGATGNRVVVEDSDALTLNIAGNIVNSAVTVIELIYSVGT